MNDPSPLPTLLTAPLQVFRGILFGQFGDCAYPAKVYSASPDESNYVKATYYALGKVIQDLDKSEQFFHVELIEPEKQAEIWLAEDWRASNTRRSRRREESRKENEEYNFYSNFRAEIYPHILQKFGGQQALAQQISNMIIKSYKTNPYPDILRELGVAEIVAKYKEQRP